MDKMDKITYAQRVRSEVKQVSAKLAVPAEHLTTTLLGIEKLADQYVAICESDGIERLTLSHAALQRAYDASTYTRPGADHTFEELLERSSVGPNYQRALPYMEAVLETAFSRMPGRS